jgi:hypothetical protein
MMRAMVSHKHGGPDVLPLADLPIPESSPPERGLVRMRAVSANGVLDLSNTSRVDFGYSSPPVLSPGSAGS